MNYCAAIILEYYCRPSREQFRHLGFGNVASAAARKPSETCCRPLSFPHRLHGCNSTNKMHLGLRYILWLLDPDADLWKEV